MTDINYRIVVDGPYSTIEKTKVPADGYLVFGRFNDAKASLESELRKQRDGITDCLYRVRGLRAVDIPAP